MWDYDFGFCSGLSNGESTVRRFVRQRRASQQNAEALLHDGRWNQNRFASGALATNGSVALATNQCASHFMTAACGSSSSSLYET